MGKNTLNKDKKKKARRRFFIESLAIFFIIATPFIFKLHELLPRNPEETISVFGLVIDRNGFADLNVYGWWLLGKFVPLYLLFIWFLTCRHWWYHIILIPIMMYAFQIFEVLVSDDKFIDTRNLLWLLPVCMVVIPFVYFIRIKLIDKYVHGIDLEAMDAELKSYREKERLQNERNNAAMEIDAASNEDLEKTYSDKTLDSLFKQFRHALQSWF